MADRAVSELIAAEKVLPTDLFVLEQSGTAKKLTGQVLENWLVSFADGHGGIQSIQKNGTDVLVDTYRITMADQTTFDFTVTNGKSITGISKSGTTGLVDNYTINYNDSTTGAFSVKNGRGITKIEKTSSSGLVDTYTVTYNDDTTLEFTVTNGQKGDKGDAMYIWIKYASQKPTESSHSFGDVIDDWIGVYAGSASSAPDDWKQYQWFQIKGETGDTGTPASLLSSKVEYQISNLGNVPPSGIWTTEIPNAVQGQYLWTRVTQTFNTGSPVVSYSVSRFGLDGKGAVSTVAGVSPDGAGNVELTASDVDALPAAGGTMEGPLNMGGQALTGLPEPAGDSDAVPKRYVVPKTGGTFNGNVSVVGELGATKFQTKVLTTDAGTVFDAVKKLYSTLNIGITLLDLTVQGSHYTFFVEKANNNYGSALMISYSAQVKYKLFNGQWSEVAY